jgi:hypothetical protein
MIWNSATKTTTERMFDLTRAVVSRLPRVSSDAGATVCNPGMRVIAHTTRGAVRFRLEAPIKGLALRRTFIDAANDPTTFAFLDNVMNGRPAEWGHSQEISQQRLRELGALISPSEIPHRTRYKCVLSEAGPFTLSTSGPRLRGSQSLPEQCFERLCASETLAWLQEAETGLEWPYWISPKQLAQVEPYSSHPRQPSESWACQLQNERLRLKADGYCFIRRLVPSSVLASLGRYFSELKDNGYLLFNDGRSLRFYAHNEPLAKWLHHHIAATVSEFIKRPITPSYSYLAIYVGGASLDRHVDRKECEYTLSLTIDQQPAGEPWPLKLDLPDGTTVVGALPPGDGLLFEGRRLPHYRDRLPESCSSTSVFFHFVLKPIDIDKE